MTCGAKPCPSGTAGRTGRRAAPQTRFVTVGRPSGTPPRVRGGPGSGRFRTRRGRRAASRPGGVRSVRRATSGPPRPGRPPRLAPQPARAIWSRRVLPSHRCWSRARGGPIRRPARPSPAGTAGSNATPRWLRGARPAGGPGEHGELAAQQQVLEHEVAARAVGGRSAASVSSRRSSIPEASPSGQRCGTREDLPFHRRCARFPRATVVLREGTRPTRPTRPTHPLRARSPSPGIAHDPRKVLTRPVAPETYCRSAHSRS